MILHPKPNVRVAGLLRESDHLVSVIDSKSYRRRKIIVTSELSCEIRIFGTKLLSKVQDPAWERGHLARMPTYKTAGKMPALPGSTLDFGLR